MSISGLSPSIAIDPRINSKAASPVVMIPNQDKGTEALPKEPVSLLSQQIQEIKSGVQVEGNKASHEQIQDSGAKLADDCSSNEGLKTKFKVENFENHTGIESQQGTTIEHHGDTVQPHETNHAQPEKTEHHGFNKDGLAMAAATGKIVYAVSVAENVSKESEPISNVLKPFSQVAGITHTGTEISEHIDNIHKAKEGIDEVADEAGKVKGIAAVSSGFVGVVSLVSMGGDINEIYKKSQETKAERTELKKEIRAQKEIINNPASTQEQIDTAKATLDGLKDQKRALNNETRTAWLELGAHSGEALKSGFEFTKAIGGTVGEKIVPGLGLVVAGFEIAKSVPKIIDLFEKRHDVKQEIKAVKAETKALNSEINQVKEDIKLLPKDSPERADLEKKLDGLEKKLDGLGEKLGDLKKEKKEINKEIFKECTKVGLAAASGVCGCIPGVGQVVGAGLSFVSLTLEKTWFKEKPAENGKKE